jgi:hypothetical protein
LVPANNKKPVKPVFKGKCTYPFRILSRLNSYVITGSSKNVAVLVMRPYNANDKHQLWCYNNARKSIFSYVDGKVFDVRGGGVPKPATDVINYLPYHGGNNQRWKFNADHTIETYARVNYVLDIYGARKNSGTKVIVYPKHRHNN